MKKQKSLRSKFIVSISLLVMVLLVAALTITMVLAMNMFWSSTEQALEQAAESGENEVTAWFAEKELMLGLIRDDMRMFDISQKDEIQEYMSHYMKTYPFTVDVYLGTPDNRMYSGSYWEPDEGYDATQREWYTGAKQKDGIYYTSPYIDAYSGMMVVSISMPVVDKNNVDMGVIALDIKLDSLVEFVNNAKIMDTSGKAFLLDSSNNFITHENSAFLPTVKGEEETYRNIKDAGIDGVEKFDFLASNLYRVKNWDQQAAYMVTRNIASNGWTYGFTVPVSDFNDVYIELILKWLAVLGGMIVVSLLAASQIAKKLLVPIQTIIKAADQLAKGDTNVSVEIKTGDELEELSDEFKLMIASTNEQIKAMEKLSNGDFTVRATPKSEQDKLSITMNNVVENLRGLVAEINESTAQVAMTSGQLANGAQSLAQGATEQAGAVDELSRSVDDILDATRDNAQYAQESTEAILAMRSKAEAGAEAMKDMVAAVQAINASSADITKIIKVIDDIAFQTGILSLNASVEAARAGQHGKGFAVVAEEIGNLAGRSAQATKETTELINASTEKVADGVSIANRTEKIFGELVEGIDQTTRSIEKIDDATEKQVEEIARVNTNVEQISLVVQQNSATAQQSAAASEELSAQTQTLKHMMDAFYIGEEAQDSKRADKFAGQDYYDMMELEENDDKY